VYIVNDRQKNLTPVYIVNDRQKNLTPVYIVNDRQKNLTPVYIVNDRQKNLQQIKQSVANELATLSLSKKDRNLLLLLIELFD
jgi:hypothetical protein